MCVHHTVRHISTAYLYSWEVCALKHPPRWSTTLLQAGGHLPSSRLNNIRLCTDHTLNPPADGHWVVSYPGYRDNAAINMGVQLSGQNPVFISFGYIAGSWTAELHDRFLIFDKLPYCFPWKLVYVSTSNVEASCPHPTSRLLDGTHPNRWEAPPRYCGSDLHFHDG